MHLLKEQGLTSLHREHKHLQGSTIVVLHAAHRSNRSVLQNAGRSLGKTGIRRREQSSNAHSHKEVSRSVHNLNAANRSVRSLRGVSRSAATSLITDNKIIMCNAAGRSNISAARRNVHNPHNARHSHSVLCSDRSPHNATLLHKGLHQLAAMRVVVAEETDS